MSAFRFANPTWIHALWPIAAMVVFLFWSDWRRGDVLSRLLSLSMQPRLVRRLSRTRRWLSIALMGLAAIALVVALMRPQWGLTYHETPQVGAQIMVCLDVSKSMLAEDTAPSRLERAKAELADLITYLQGDQVGLIAFAGRAAVLCPLTPDFGFFRLILDGAGPHCVGLGGTRLEEPIRKALDGFRTESDVSRLIVLITDGEDHDSHPVDVAKAAAERGIKILTIGFGDEAGTEIEYADPQSGVRTVVRDSAGTPVVSRLDGETLRQIALETEGAYIPAGTGALDLKSIYDAHIAPLVRGKQDARGHAVRREGFQWAVLAGLILAVASIAVGSRSVGADLERPAAESAPSRPSQLGAAVLLAALACGAVAHAQQPLPGDAAATEGQASDAAPAPSGKGLPDLEGREPRDLYNQALADLDQDLDRAEQLLAEARRQSGTDGEVRFRATYNLGWVEVKRADAILAKEPQGALLHLRRAADWFRDAVRLRSDHQDARYNLELVLRRILELADSLAKTEEGDMAQRLDALIVEQRNLVATARQVVERVAAANDPNAAEGFQGDFRQLAVQQRMLLAESQALSIASRQELEALDGKSEQEKSAQDRVRAAQLGGVLHYTNRAEQRMGQARSQMRQRQADRAFRRAAVALDELKRARDQLRGPVEVLDVILADAGSLVQAASSKATAAGPIASSPAPTPPPVWLTREYLEEEQLSLTQRTSELAAQLQAGLDQKASQPAGPPTPDQQEKNGQAERFLAMVRDAMPHLNKGKEAFDSAGQALASDQLDEAVERQFQAIAALRNARERFLELRGLIELTYSHEVQIQGLLAGLQQSVRADETGPADSGQEKAALKEPATIQTPAPTENRADTKPTGSAEKPAPTEKPAQEASPAEMPSTAQAPAGNEQSTSAAAAAPQQARTAAAATEPATNPAPGEPAAATDWAVPMEQQLAILGIAGAGQTDNIDRGQRIADLIERGLRELPGAPAEASAQAPSQQDPAARQAAAQRQQLEMASQLVRPALDEMRAASDVLAKSIGQSDSEKKPDETTRPVGKVDREVVSTCLEHVSQAVDHLQALRRLFFSIVEHLRETAQRQAQLNDETEQVAAVLDDGAAAKKAGPLSARQQELRKTAGEIANALDDQAKQSSAGAPAGEKSDPQQLAELQHARELLAKAAKLVGDGGTAMESAEKNLSLEKPVVDEARKNQDQALGKLVEALELLQPPQPDEQNQQGEHKPNEDQQQQDQQQGNDEHQPEKSEMGTDPARLLQAIRDREAQRSRERERRARLEQEPVEKDW